MFGVPKKIYEYYINIFSTKLFFSLLNLNNPAVLISCYFLYFGTINISLWLYLQNHYDFNCN